MDATYLKLTGNTGNSLYEGIQCIPTGRPRSYGRSQISVKLLLQMATSLPTRPPNPIAPQCCRRWPRTPFGPFSLKVFRPVTLGEALTRIWALPCVLDRLSPKVVGHLATDATILDCGPRHSSFRQEDGVKVICGMRAGIHTYIRVCFAFCRFLLSFKLDNMAANLDLSSTMGIWLLSVFLEALLQGMGMLQCFLYFVWYHKDPWSFKATVILLMTLECIQMGASFANIYDWFINEFGDFDALRFIGWSDMLQLTALHLAIFVAQAHFARCIYHLQKENIILPVLISILALVALGGGLGQVVLCIRLGEYSKIGATKVTDNLQAAAALAADGLITFGLCWRLNRGRGGIQSTNKMLNFLIMTAVNRGGCTIIFAALNIILFFSRPGTFDFMLVIFISDKFYMNSLLAMLNTRQYAVNVGGAEGMVMQHLSLPVFEANSHTSMNTVSISISTTHQTDEPLVSGKLDV
ncbi:hypothetical protein C8R47DRAFT_1127355 [Mycena vitilis]|nr:hypothetical protein C8R47DRAFT_1127355 [Mycena vitilis]